MIEANTTNTTVNNIETDTARHSTQSLRLWNSYTHAAGAVLSAVAMSLMLNIGIAQMSLGQDIRRYNLRLFIIVLYTMSAIYHFAVNPKIKAVLLILLLYNISADSWHLHSIYHAAARGHKLGH